MMVESGVITRNDRHAFQEVELGFRALSIRAGCLATNHRTTFWKAFFMLGSMNPPERSPYHGG
jgi:hypothetical protein